MLCADIEDAVNQDSAKPAKGVASDRNVLASNAVFRGGCAGPQL